MAWRDVSSVRNLAIFLCAIAACVLAPSVVRHFVDGLFEEFRAPIDAIPSQLNDLGKYWSLHSNSKRSLIEAGRDLARINSAYELKMLENKNLQDRVARYEDILNLPPEDSYKFEVARIARRDINAWWQQMVIRKGRVHGIKEGYAVIYSGGVVGRIAKANLYTSVVELVSSRNFRMAAHFDGEDRPVIYQGAGAVSLQDAKGEVRDVPGDVRASVSEPRLLVTSALTGTFPEGIRIGEVVDLSLGADGLFKSGTVRLGRALSTLREVTVLIPISEIGK